ncbi:uncharacterized protein HKW66_Vig0210210 [Vigna angularis]|uniref:Uncharacterized protein n=1 Tax=Phaseolus angularis TaxID=3914 RepID=A0A8T0JIN0_PHAAN|nr:uncharacterized protein HKW66_Vig0210210 [Vigna angularis]
MLIGRKRSWKVGPMEHVSFVRGAHPAGRERDEEKGQQREAPVTDHVRPQVVAANANELVLDDVAGGEAVVEIGEGDVGLSLRILLSKGMSEVVTTTGKLFQFNTSANNPDVVHRKSENREPYRVFIEQPDAFSFHQRTKSPFNPFIADKQPQEKRTFFSQSSSKPLQFFNRASLDLREQAPGNDGGGKLEKEEVTHTLKGEENLGPWKNKVAQVDVTMVVGTLQIDIIGP